MSLARCPACRARLPDEPVCPRCACDLTLVRRADAQAQSWVARALQAWARGDLPQARACASAALLLQQHPLAKVVLHSLDPKRIDARPQPAVNSDFGQPGSAMRGIGPHYQPATTDGSEIRPDHSV